MMDLLVPGLIAGFVVGFSIGIVFTLRVIVKRHDAAGSDGKPK